MDKTEDNEVLEWKNKVLNEMIHQKKDFKSKMRIRSRRFDVATLKLLHKALVNDPKREHNALSTADKRKLSTT